MGGPSEASVDAGAVRRITILSLSALGDLLLAIPLVEALRKLYPDARITLVCERGATAAMAEELKIGDRVVQLPAKARRNPLALFQSILLVRAQRPHLIFQTFASHGTFGNLLMGATDAEVRSGFASGRFQNFLTHALPITDDKHYVTLNLDLLRQTKKEAPDPTGRFLPPIEQNSTLPHDFGRYVVVSMGCDPVLAFKRWPHEKWRKLLAMLQADKLRLVFVGAESERADIEALNVPGENLAGKTSFSDLAALIRDSALVLGTDGMILHFAAAMDKPCVGIFGPTNEVWGGPWRQTHRVARLPSQGLPPYRATTVGRVELQGTQDSLLNLPEEAVYQKVKAAL